MLRMQWDDRMRIRARIEELEISHGGLRKAAQKVDIDAGYLCRLKHGIDTSPSDATLKKLGLVKTVDYKRR